jgi:hypothetical protein
MANHNESIPAVKRAVADSMQLRFSFKHFDFRNPKFQPSECSTNYFERLFQILHAFSNWTVGSFVDQNNNDHRHIIDFEQTTELDGFQHINQIDAEQLGYMQGWQFGVYPQEPGNRWRAHGILVDDIFYLVWLDQHHRLYP